jgi:hypothetical protein
VIGAAAVAGWRSPLALVERRAPEPLLPLKLFRMRTPGPTAASPDRRRCSG